MSMAYIFGLPAALLIVALAANRLSKLTRVPDIIVLLLIGITLGPILHWVNPAALRGRDPHSGYAGADPDPVRGRLGTAPSPGDAILSRRACCWWC